MAFKWNKTYSSLQVACQKCGKIQEIELSDFEVTSTIEPKPDSDYLTRHYASTELFCKDCGNLQRVGIEFIEFPQGICDSINADPIFRGQYLEDLVDFEEFENDLHE